VSGGAGWPQGWGLAERSGGPWVKAWLRALI